MSTSAGRVPAAIYVRISQDAEDTGLGVARQRRDCEALAKDKGWDVAKVYTDNDVSASNGRPRPAYERMAADVEAGKLQSLVVWDVDRLTRTPRELEDVIVWAERHGLHLASVGGDIDLSTPQGRMTARIKGTVARHEVEQSSRRIRRKRQELAEQGRYVGPRPYGWDFTPNKGLVINENEAAVVREAVERTLAGESIRSIVFDFNARGTLTGRGKRWQAANFRAMVMRRTNCAVLTHRGEEVGPGDWPAIISREDHERVVSLLTHPSRRTTNRGTEVKYLLTGLINCAECGTPLQGAREYTYTTHYQLADNTRRPYQRTQPDRYRCQAHGCRKVTQRMNDLDAWVSRFSVTLLKQWGVQVLGGSPKAADAARARREAITAKLNRAADQYAEDQITAEQLQRISAKLRPQLEEAGIQLADAMPTGGLTELVGPDVQQAWDSASLEKRRAAIRALLDYGLTISVGKVGLARGREHGPAPFNPDTVKFTWKGGTVDAA